MAKKQPDIHEQLRQDARSVQGGARPDARLHQETMRRIRQLGPAGSDRQATGHRWLPIKAAVAVSVALACWLVILSLPDKPETGTPGSGTPETAQTTGAKAGTPLAYHAALAEGEAAVLAMLDREARTTLPRSADIFIVRR